MRIREVDSSSYNEESITYKSINDLFEHVSNFLHMNPSLEVIMYIYSEIERLTDEGKL